MAIILDCNLRLWSDTQKLDDLIPEFPHPPEYLYRKGEVVDLLASGRRHIPSRHYASFPTFRCSDMAMIEPWLHGELDRLERCILTSGIIRMGMVEAVFWIATFTDAPVARPSISVPLIERLRAAGARALIENYAPPSLAAPGTQTECPAWIWYPPDEASPATPSQSP